VEYDYGNLLKIAQRLTQSDKIDFLTFKIMKSPEEEYKKYRDRPFTHTLRTLSNIGIIDVAFKEETIEKYNLAFDERFGPGGHYPIGEDFIFLTDALKSGARIEFVPLPVVYHKDEGTGYRLEPDIVFGRGAMFGRVFGRMAPPAALYHGVKKYRFYKSRFGFSDYMKLLFAGIVDFCFKRYRCE
jgi:hypothetical protein